MIEIWGTTAGWYRPEVNRAQMNLLDSHDVPRALHSLNGDVAALKLALLLLFLQPGAPCLYYGTEAGLAGGPDAEQSSGPEPACREAFPWDEPWGVDLRPYLAELAGLRQRYPDLRAGATQWMSHGSDGLSGTTRSHQIWINRSHDQTLPVCLSGSNAKVLWTCGAHQARPADLQLSQRCCCWG